MIRPTHLIRRTTSCLADLALNAVATLGCYWQTRWEAYQAGAQAAIRGELEHTCAGDALMDGRRVWTNRDACPGCTGNPDAARIARELWERNAARAAFADYDAALEAEALWFAKWEQQFHPSNGGAL